MWNDHEMSKRLFRCGWILGGSAGFTIKLNKLNLRASQPAEASKNPIKNRHYLIYFSAKIPDKQIMVVRFLKANDENDRIN